MTDATYSTVTTRVPISLIKIQSTDTAGTVAFQTFTTNKLANSLSVGYDNSGVYAEAGSLTGDANGITMTGLYKLDTLPTAPSVAGNDSPPDPDDS